jgi:hypothetical protein
VTSTRRRGARASGSSAKCFTCGFALAAAVDDSVLAPVLSQPSAPVPLGLARRRDTGLSEAEMSTIVDRCSNDGLCAMGLRFSEDKLSPPERFASQGAARRCLRGDRD